MPLTMCAMQLCQVMWGPAEPQEPTIYLQMCSHTPQLTCERPYTQRICELLRSSRYMVSGGFVEVLTVLLLFDSCDDESEAEEDGGDWAHCAGLRS